MLLNVAQRGVWRVNCLLVVELISIKPVVKNDGLFRHRIKRGQTGDLSNGNRKTMASLRGAAPSILSHKEAFTIVNA